jgi:hypothetical protein
MTKTACMICGREPPFDFQITRERDKEADPDRKELEIHIKRTHSLEEMQRHINPGRKRKAKAGEEGEQPEQEGEESVKTDDVVAELFKKEGGEGTGTPRSARSRSRGSSRSRKSRTQSPAALVKEEVTTADASSQDL